MQMNTNLRPFFLLFGTLAMGIPLYIAVVNLCGIVGKKPWMSLAFIGSLAAAWYVCLRISRRPAEVRSTLTEEMLQEEGRLEVTELKARRSFGIEEFEDEGPSYFLELEDGRVLFLSGQYLYNAFPCAHFKLKRDTQYLGIFDVEPLSDFLPPEKIFPPFTTRDCDSDWFPSDGDFLTGTYDSWKARIAARKTDF